MTKADLVPLSTPRTAWRDWARGVALSIVSVRDEVLQKAAEIILGADLILTAGNGGSSAIASHAAQAIGKPDYAAGGGRAAVCLTDNIPALTAHANDGGWPDALVELARPFLDAAAKPALLAISSSGKSENVVRLARFAQKNSCPVVAMTGFEGEPLRGLGTVSLHVFSHDYEVVEPVHDALLHRIQYHLRALGRQENGK